MSPPYGSGCDGQDGSASQEVMEAATPAHRLLCAGRFLILHPKAVPGTGSVPVAEGIAVDGATLTEQNQQGGLIVVVRDQSPGTHGAAVDAVAQDGHVGGGDVGDDGSGAHGRGCRLDL